MTAAGTAEAEVSLEYLGPLDAEFALDVEPIGDFILGHPGNPVHVLTDPDLYQTFTRCSILSPEFCGCDCPSGYLPVRYNLVFAKVGDGLRDGQAMMRFSHEWALDHYPPGTECFEPFHLALPYIFPFFCEADASFTVEQEGYYRLEFPVDVCDCIFVEYTQGLHIPCWWGEGWGEDLFLVTDEDPGHCPDFAGEPGMGYFWYREIEAPGNLLMWADAVCCDAPIDVDPASWDHVKALYR